MKWLIIPAIATSFVSLHFTDHLNIQHGHGQQHHADSAKVAKAINLNKEQSDNVKEVRFQLLRQFINAHMEGKNITPAAHKELAAEASAQIQRILNANQFKSLADHGGPSSLLDMGTAHMELFARLNVTKEQNVKLHEIISGGLHKKAKGNEDPFHQIHDILTLAQLQRLHELLVKGKA